MEVKVNKEIREYKEHIFFGLSMRQFFFSILACLVALILYFIFREYVEIETLSWLCILGAFPFAALGFITYNGMPAEKIILVWITSEILMPKILKNKKQSERETDQKDITKNKINKDEIIKAKVKVLSEKDKEKIKDVIEIDEKDIQIVDSNYAKNSSSNPNVINLGPISEEKNDISNLINIIRK